MIIVINCVWLYFRSHSFCELAGHRDMAACWANGWECETAIRWGSLQKAFEAIDLDESGAISFDEFKKCGWTQKTGVTLLDAKISQEIPGEMEDNIKRSTNQDTFEFACSTHPFPNVSVFTRKPSYLLTTTFRVLSYGIQDLYNWRSRFIYSRWLQYRGA